MKYFIIAGEASGDLHGSNLMAALKEQDADADFCFFGGDLMLAQGGRLIKHYREMAFMGFIPVLMNLRTIFRNMKICREEIVKYQPDVVILIDYPGFNLKIAKFVKTQTNIPVYYYISPKVWAWKEYRVKSFKKYVDEMFSILPFEVDFFKKHNYDISYVGNPTVDAVDNYRKVNGNDTEELFISENSLENKPIIALLAGSRLQEIKNNLPSMLEALESMGDYQAVIAGAPAIEHDYYKTYIGDKSCKIVFGQTYRLLTHSKAALVTSGTATLETALFRVPQVVCYKMAMPRLTYWAFKNILHTKYISLVNLIADKTVVQELFAKFFSVDNIRTEVDLLLNNTAYRKQMLDGYDRIINILGKPGASEHAAKLMVKKLDKKNRKISALNYTFSIMKNNLLTIQNALLYCSKLRSWRSNRDIECFKSIFPFSSKLNEKKEEIETLLPYHFNIIDVLKTDENAHSRFLTKLLSHKEKTEDKKTQYPTLESLVKYLENKYSGFSFPHAIEKPRVTCEKMRIDTLIQESEKYAIIIENKIHGAIDQEAQIERYIARNQEMGFRPEQIFVLYLTKEGGEPNDKSWGETKDTFRVRYLAISYKEDIFPWLTGWSNELKQISKNNLFNSAILHYLEHLNQFINNKNTSSKMDKELNEFLTKELGLGDNHIDNKVCIEHKINELNSTKNQLDSLRQEIEYKIWEGWLDRIKNNPLFSKYKIFSQDNTQRHPQVGIIIEYNNLKFAILIEKETNIYFGAGCHHASETLHDEIKTILLPLLNNFEKDSPWWYGWKYADYEDIYPQFESLATKVIEHISDQTATVSH